VLQSIHGNGASWAFREGKIVNVSLNGSFIFSATQPLYTLYFTFHSRGNNLWLFGKIE